MSPQERTPAHVADMLQFAGELRSLASRVGLDQYLADRVLNLAFEKLFINLGEAANRIAQEQRDLIPGVPWRQIIGLRNILAHGYEQVDPEALFRTASGELASVENALRSWLEALPSAPEA